MGRRPLLPTHPHPFLLPLMASTDLLLKEWCVSCWQKYKGQWFTLSPEASTVTEERNKLLPFITQTTELEPLLVRFFSWSFEKERLNALHRSSISEKIFDTQKVYHTSCPWHNMCVVLNCIPLSIPFWQWSSILSRMERWSHIANLPTCRWVQATPEFLCGLSFGCIPLHSPSHLLPGFLPPLLPPVSSSGLT